MVTVWGARPTLRNLTGWLRLTVTPAGRSAGSSVIKKLGFGEGAPCSDGSEREARIEKPRTKDDLAAPAKERCQRADRKREITDGKAQGLHVQGEQQRVQLEEILDI
jgi:hypothetical protein